MNMLERILELGATDVRILNMDQIVTDKQYRELCASNACGNYGKCYMCPPDIGEIDLLISDLRKYSKALVYQTVHPLEDSYDFEGMMDGGKAHIDLSQSIEEEKEALFGKGALHLSCGGCRLCDNCEKRLGNPCRYPDRALTSLEAYGVDVSSTVIPLGMKYINGADTVTYFGMICYTEGKDAQLNC